MAKNMFGKGDPSEESSSASEEESSSASGSASEEESSMPPPKRMPFGKGLQAWAGKGKKPPPF